MEGKGQGVPPRAEVQPAILIEQKYLDTKAENSPLFQIRALVWFFLFSLSLMVQVSALGVVSFHSEEGCQTFKRY